MRIALVLAQIFHTQILIDIARIRKKYTVWILTNANKIWLLEYIKVGFTISPGLSMRYQEACQVRWATRYAGKLPLQIYCAHYTYYSRHVDGMMEEVAESAGAHPMPTPAPADK